jgi:hypothetical protein
LFKNHEKIVVHITSLKDFSIDVKNATMDPIIQKKYDNLIFQKNKINKNILNPFNKNYYIDLQVIFIICKKFTKIRINV